MNQVIIIEQSVMPPPAMVFRTGSCYKTYRSRDYKNHLLREIVGITDEWVFFTISTLYETVENNARGVRYLPRTAFESMVRSGAITSA